VGLHAKRQPPSRFSQRTTLRLRPNQFGPSIPLPEGSALAGVNIANWRTIISEFATLRFEKLVTKYCFCQRLISLDFRGARLESEMMLAKCFGILVGRNCQNRRNCQKVPRLKSQTLPLMNTDDTDQGFTVQNQMCGINFLSHLRGAPQPPTPIWDALG
jgi:hypothetical protein